MSEVVKDPLGIVGLPGIARLAGGVLLVEAVQQVHQLTTDRLDPQQLGKLRETDKPIGIPAGPIVISTIHDPEDPMMGLTCLVRNSGESNFQY